MSSIIKRRMHAVLRAAAVLTAITLGWFAAMAGILLATEKADAVLVVFPLQPSQLVLPDSVAILDWDGHQARFIGTRPGYVQDLYRAGALAVLPARTSGCIQLRRS